MTESYVIPRTKKNKMISGISRIGKKIYGKTRDYCSRIIQEQKQSVAHNIERVQQRIADYLEDAIIIYIHEANLQNQGMVIE